MRSGWLGRIWIIVAALVIFGSGAVARADEEAPEAAAPAAEAPAAEVPAAEAATAEAPAAEAPAAEAPAAEAAATGEPGAAEAPAATVPAAPAEAPAGTPAGDDEALDEAAAAAGLQMDPARLRELLERARETAQAKILDKLERSQAQQMDRVSALLGFLSLAGVLLLFAPLALRKRFPGQTGTLLRYGALAGLTFFLAVNLFAFSLQLVRGVQGALGPAVNPQMAIVDGAIDTLSDNADEIAGIGGIIEPALAKMEEGVEESPAVALAVTLAGNLQALGKDVSALRGLAGFFRSLSGVLGLLPILLSLVAVVLFVVAFKPTLLTIIRMPIDVAEGRATGRQVVGKVFRTVGREFLVTLLFVLVLIATTVLAGAMLGLVVRPAIEALLGFVLGAFAYLMTEPSPSTGLLLASLAGVGVFLALNIAVVLASTAFYLGKAHKILRARLHDGVPLAAHKRFWGRGTLALVWAQLLPLLFIAVAEKGVEKIFDAFGAESQLVTALALAALVLTLGFALVYWAARGVAAVKLLLRYQVAPPPPALDPAWAAPPPARPAAA